MIYICKLHWNLQSRVYDEFEEYGNVWYAKGRFC